MPRPSLGLVVALTVALSGCTVPWQGIDLLEPFAREASGLLRVHVVDVGQGDGVVWELPDGALVVYDCGPPVAADAPNPVVEVLHGLGLRPGGTLHALIASHGHLDHIGGCEEVMETFRVLHLYEAWYDGPDAPKSYARFRDQVRSEGGTVHTAASSTGVEDEVVFRAGDLVHLPREAIEAGARAEVLWPTGLQGHDWDDIAESSIAVRLSFGQRAFCFQGDVEAVQERRLVERLGPGRGCDAYLVGHHGSRYASSADWLQAMAPEVAVVSFGANGYGHPTAEALCRVQQAGAEVYATDRLGTVVLATDGTTLIVAPDAPESQDYCSEGADYWAE